MSLDAAIRSTWFRLLGLFLIATFAGQSLYLTKAIRTNWLFLSQRETEGGPAHEESSKKGQTAVVAVSDGARGPHKLASHDTWSEEKRPRPWSVGLARQAGTFADEFLLAGPLGGRLRC